jgi:acyl dehydratase
MIQVKCNRRDTILYAISIGCDDLTYIYENHPKFQAFPTILFGLTLKGNADDTQPFPPAFFPDAQVPINGPVLDGERFMELSRPLVAGESLSMKFRIGGVEVKPSGVIVQIETRFFDSQGLLVARLLSNTFYVGSSGVRSSGQMTQLIKPIPLDRPADLTVDERTNKQQAHLYRLNGDYNPLHIDPEISASFGFPRPIIHGLCTLGFATRIVVDRFFDNQASLIRRVGCRFSKPAYPGTLLRVLMWKCGANSVSFRVIDGDSGSIVVDCAFAEGVAPVSGKL